MELGLFDLVTRSISGSERTAAPGDHARVEVLMSFRFGISESIRAIPFLLRPLPPLPLPMDSTSSITDMDVAAVEALRCENRFVLIVISVELLLMEDMGGPALRVRLCARLAPISPKTSRPDLEGLNRPESASSPKFATRDLAIAVGVVGRELGPTLNWNRPNW
jgi:hypothetical protein